jgi:hypothetical protein
VENILQKFVATHRPGMKPWSVTDTVPSGR